MSSQSTRGGRPTRKWRVRQLEGPQYSQSIECGLAILQVFTPERPVLGISEIAEAVEMSRPTTHRYAITLVTLGFLEQTRRRKYRLGVRCHDVGMSALDSTDLRAHTHSFLRELRRRTGWSASVAVLDGSDVLYLDRAQSWHHGEHELRLNIRAGSRLPAYCTALGKALIAALPADERRELIAGIELKRRGPNTITGKRALSSEIERVFEQGIAVDNEECAPGLVAAAVPLPGKPGEIDAAVALEAPAGTISPDKLADVATGHMVAAAGLISGRLGYRRPGEVTQCVQRARPSAYPEDCPASGASQFSPECPNQASSP